MKYPISRNKTEQLNITLREQKQADKIRLLNRWNIIMRKINTRRRDEKRNASWGHISKNYITSQITIKKTRTTAPFLNSLLSKIAGNDARLKWLHQMEWVTMSSTSAKKKIQKAHQKAQIFYLIKIRQWTASRQIHYTYLFVCRSFFVC